MLSRQAKYEHTPKIQSHPKYQARSFKSRIHRLLIMTKARWVFWITTHAGPAVERGFNSSFVSEEPHRGQEIDCRKAIN